MCDFFMLGQNELSGAWVRGVDPCLRGAKEGRKEKWHTFVISQTSQSYTSHNKLLKMGVILSSGAAVLGSDQQKYQ